MNNLAIFFQRHYLLIVYLTGTLPAYIARLLTQPSTENFFNPVSSKIQVILFQILGLFLVMITIMLLIDLFLNDGFFLHPIIAFVVPFIANGLFQSFSRDSFVLQTLLQSLLFLLVFLSSKKHNWYIEENVTQIAVVSFILMFFLALITLDSAWVKCRIDKCLFEGQYIFVGQFTTGNSASVFFGFLCAVTFLSESTKVQKILIPVFFAGVILSGGRSPLIALCFAIIAYQIRSKVLRMLCGLALLAISVVPVLHDFDSRFLTFRGYLWSATRSYLKDMNGYSANITFSEFVNQQLYFVPRTTLSPHNLWLNIWWDSGLIGLLLFLPIALGLFLYLSKSGKSVFLLFIYFLTLNITEPITSFHHFDSFSWLLLILLVSWKNEMLLKLSKDKFD